MSNYMKTCPSSFSKARVPHFCSPSTLNSLQGMLKVSNCRSSWFNLCRGKWQVPSWKWNSLSHVQLFVTPRSVLGILQARILELDAIPFSRGFSWLRDQTGVSQQILYHLSYQGNLANTLGKYQDAAETFPLLLFFHECHLPCVSPSPSPCFSFSSFVLLPQLSFTSHSSLGIGLATEFVWVFLSALTEKLEWTFLGHSIFLDFFQFVSKQSTRFSHS